MESTRTDHPHIAHGVANLGHQSTELIQVTVSLGGQTQLPDAFVELITSVKWILVEKIKLMNAQ